MSLKITALTHELRLPVNLGFSKNTGNAEGQEPQKKGKGEGEKEVLNHNPKEKGYNENKRFLKCSRYA